MQHPRKRRPAARRRQKLLFYDDLGGKAWLMEPAFCRDVVETPLRELAHEIRAQKQASDIYGRAYRTMTFSHAGNIAKACGLPDASRTQLILFMRAIRRMYRETCPVPVAVD